MGLLLANSFCRQRGGKGWNDSFIRPHDVELRVEPNGTTSEAMVERIVHLGFEVRVELVLARGEPIRAQVTRDQADELDLHVGQVVFVRPDRVQVFDRAR